MISSRTTPLLLLPVFLWSLLAAQPGSCLTPQAGGLVAAAEGVDTGAVDRFVESQMARHGIPGASLAIIEDGRVVHTQGYGDAGGGRLMSATTPMPIASITKSFTAVAVLQLVQDGRLELDAPVRRYLPWFEVADAEVSVRITVRHLLQHTSGLSDLGYRRVLDPDTSLADGVRDLRHAEPTAGPGRKHQYFNPNYAVAALIVQEVTGRPYADVVRDRILSPLGMVNSTADPAAAPDDLAQGFVTVFGFAVPRNAPVRQYRDGADNLVSTAPDLARFAVAVGLAGTDSPLLTNSGLKAMRTAPPVEGAAYGLGWALAEHRGDRVEGHEGLDPTFSGQMWVLPERGRGYVLLTNQGHLIEKIVAFPQLRNGMLDLLAGRDAEVGGVGWRVLGLGLLLVFAVTMVFNVRSLIRLRSWPRRTRRLSGGRRAWQTGSHFLTAALLLLVMYQLVPLLLGRAFNLTEIGLYHLPDITLIVAGSVLSDVVAGTAMAVMLLTGSLNKPGSSEGASASP